MTNGYADWGSSKPSSTKKGKSGESSKSTVEKTPVYKDSSIHNGDRFSIGGGIDAAYNALGNLIDKGFDNTLGELIYNATGQTVDPRRWLTGENLGTALDIGSDILLPIVAPGVGSAIVAGKAAMQNMPTFVEALEGVDKETGEELTGAQKWLKGATSLGNVALMSMPLAGQLAKTVKLGKVSRGLFGDNTARSVAERAFKEERAAAEAAEKDLNAAREAYQEASKNINGFDEVNGKVQKLISLGKEAEAAGNKTASREYGNMANELEGAAKNYYTEDAINAANEARVAMNAAEEAATAANAGNAFASRFSKEVGNATNFWKKPQDVASNLKGAWADTERGVFKPSMKKRRAALSEEGIVDDFDMANSVGRKIQSGERLTPDDYEFLQTIENGVGLGDPRAIEVQKIFKGKTFHDPAKDAEKYKKAKEEFEKAMEKAEETAKSEFRGIGKDNKGFRPGQLIKDAAAYGTAGYANFLAENEGATPWDMIQSDPAAFIGAVLGSALLRRANVGAKLPTVRGYSQDTLFKAGNLGPSNAILRSIIAGQLGTNQQTQQLLEDENGDTYEGLRDVADEIVRGGRPLYRRGYLSENYSD